MAREYFIAYHSYLKSMEPLGDAARGRLFTACLRYSESGTEPVFRGSERFVWPTIRGQIDRDMKNYDERCQANRKNVLRRYTNEYDGLRTATKTTKEKEKEKEKAKTKTTENEKETALSFPHVKEREGADAPCADKPRRARKPSVQEIKDYCAKKGYELNAQLFFDYYETRGWRTKGSDVKSWQAAVRTWIEREKDDAATHAQQGGCATTQTNRGGRLAIEQHDYTESKLNALLVDLDTIPDED